jgi:hypothetical protein
MSNRGTSSEACESQRYCKVRVAELVSRFSHGDMRISMVQIPTTVIPPVHGCTQIVKDVVEVFHGVLIWNWMTRDELRVVVLRLQCSGFRITSPWC